jgi:hypothetical protein
VDLSNMYLEILLTNKSAQVLWVSSFNDLFFLDRVFYLARQISLSATLSASTCNI